MLNSLLEDVPEPRGDMATEPPPQQDDIARGRDVLAIGPHLAPGTHPIEPDPTVAGRPSHLPNQGSDLAVELGDGRLQVALRLLQRPSVLRRQLESGAWPLPSPVWKVSTEARQHKRITHAMVDHTMKRPNMALM